MIDESPLHLKVDLLALGQVETTTFCSYVDSTSLISCELESVLCSLVVICPTPSSTQEIIITAAMVHVDRG